MTKHTITIEVSDTALEHLKGVVKNHVGVIITDPLACVKHYLQADADRHFSKLAMQMVFSSDMMLQNAPGVQAQA